VCGEAFEAAGVELLRTEWPVEAYDSRSQAEALVGKLNGVLKRHKLHESNHKHAMLLDDLSAQVSEATQEIHKFDPGFDPAKLLDGWANYFVRSIDYITTTRFK
jgi:hypothetical protein